MINIQKNNYGQIIRNLVYNYAKSIYKKAISKGFEKVIVRKYLARLRKHKKILDMLSDMYMLLRKRKRLKERRKI